MRNALEQAGWETEDKTNWIAVNDGREEFAKVFGNKRIGKIIGTTFFVTPKILNEPVLRLINDLGLHPEYVTSTSGSGRIFPGIAFSDISQANVSTFVTRLCEEVNARLAAGSGK